MFGLCHCHFVRSNKYCKCSNSTREYVRVGASNTSYFPVVVEIPARDRAAEGVCGGGGRGCRGGGGGGGGSGCSGGVVVVGLTAMMTCLAPPPPSSALPSSFDADLIGTYHGRETYFFHSGIVWVNFVLDYVLWY
jgi:hypothetical protein